MSDWLGYLGAKIYFQNRTSGLTSVTKLLIHVYCLSAISQAVALFLYLLLPWSLQTISPSRQITVNNAGESQGLNLMISDLVMIILFV